MLRIVFIITSNRDFGNYSTVPTVPTYFISININLVNIVSVGFGIVSFPEIYRKVWLLLLFFFTEIEKEINRKSPEQEIK